MDINAYLDATTGPLNYQTGQFANLCQADGCRVETLGDNDLCPLCQREHEAAQDDAAAELVAQIEDGDICGVCHGEIVITNISPNNDEPADRECINCGRGPVRS